MKRAAIAFAVPLLAAAVVAQQPSTPSAQLPAAPPAVTSSEPGRYVGVGSCVNSGCHGSTEPLNATRVLQNEFYTWLDSDRHADAYNVLFKPSSARIARNMRLKRKAYEEPVCLDCHTTNVPVHLVAGAVDHEDGVQCETCHGPASGWRDQHVEEGWTHAQSIAKGMIDLRSLNTRSSVCSACHVGNAEKEVDHELIASGHPRLAFELDNYTESMPPHWRPNERSHGVPAWTTGQVMKFRDSLDNLARHARGDKWPEFSDMDCVGCHHSLAGSEPRQERGWPGRAGLPGWSPQHWAVLRVLIGHLSPGSREELDPIVAQIARSVSRMNDPASVASNAQRASRIVSALIAKAESKNWSEREIRTLMTSIAGSRQLADDVQSAEQAALALQSLSSALTRRNPRLLRSPMTRAIDALFDEIKDRNAFDTASFTRKLEAVRVTL
jgi:hypothetical protein